MVSLTVACTGSPPQLVFATAFPFRIGRAASCGLVVSAPGVWDQHAVIDLDGDERKFRVASVGEAVLMVNGVATSAAVLRNGDLLDLGACRLTFALAPAGQKSLAPRECFAWGLLALGLLLEICLFLKLN